MTTTSPSADGARGPVGTDADRRALTDDELKAIEERANAATEGPWGYSVDRETEYPAQLFSDDDGRETDLATFEQGWDSEWAPEMAANAEFVSNAREDVPALVAEVRRLRGKNEELRNAVDAHFRRADAAVLASEQISHVQRAAAWEKIMTGIEDLKRLMK